MAVRMTNCTPHGASLIYSAILTISRGVVAALFLPRHVGDFARRGGRKCAGHPFAQAILAISQEVVRPPRGALPSLLRHLGRESIM
jgi:hypothetical protein